MKSLFSIFFILALSVIGFAENDEGIIEIQQDTNVFKFVKTPGLFTEKWDTLAEPSFWRLVMGMSPDSCVLNVARTRQVLHKESVENWDKLTDDQKEMARMKLREIHGLDSTERIFMTTGKRDFYQFDLVYPSIKRGIEVFEDNQTDPWYAQAILMIESPGKLKHSVSGAYGPFQLMKSVARTHGLRVDKYVDERKDFDKSAYGSAHLLRTTCIPESKRILSQFGIQVEGADEKSLWFRLLVLHVYHAGAGNVNGVLSHVVQPNCGCNDVITALWHSEYGNFRNSSQNYSQLALASLFVLDDFVQTHHLSVE